MFCFKALLACLFVSLSLAATISDRGYLKDFVTTEKRIKAHGYPAESHIIETEDGYLLNIFRIPYSHKLQNANINKPVVLLQHGLLSNSDCWLSNGPNDSLAYLLADAGFDVWMGNARGNIYSRANTKISLNSPKFWHFDWHEIAVIDMATMIDYILDQTKETKIHYAGHSQGTTVYFVLLSERPEYNEKIQSAHMLAPCAYYGQGSSPGVDFLHSLFVKPDGIWTNLLRDLEFIPQNSLINRLIDTTCGSDPKAGPFCHNFYVWFAGDGYENTNISSLQNLVETHPGGGSSNQGIHYIQLGNSHKFQQFDWGPKKNQQLYNQPTPPEYNLTKITAPTYLYSGAKDSLCGPEDVDILVSHLPNLTEDIRIPIPSWNHLDFLVANQMKTVLNEPIIRNMQKYETKN